MSSLPSTLKLGTRGSLLARAQSQQVADELMRCHPGLRVALEVLSTSGDRITDRPLAELGGKGLFTRELEEALLDRRIDFAVHSFKDVPVTMPLVDQRNLAIVTVPARVDARDVLVVRQPAAGASAKDILAHLPAGAIIGTGSPRRRSQLLALRPDLSVRGIRGNIDTRLRKLREGQFDAIVLAAAGLQRAGLFDASIMAPFELAEMLPAAGQGALALECRAEDAAARALLAALDDPATRTCVEIERGIVAGLNGDCHSPIAAHATWADGHLHLRAAVGARGGELPLVRAEATHADPQEALACVLADLQRQGASERLS